MQDIVSELFMETPEIVYHGDDFLHPDWCECKKPDWICGREEGECPCGIWQKHTHCKCGGIITIG